MNKSHSPKSGFKSTPLTFNGGIGSSSILVIFVILCLVSFATLSIVSANADYKLSTKILDRTTAYYEAQNQAEEELAQLDSSLRGTYETASSSAEYFDITGHETTFLISVSELQSLEVTVQILYPDNPAGSYYQVLSRKVITTQELDYDSTLNVIK